ncbi:MAG: acetolactate synthase large subunit, partial [Duncaniella sp.]|nr:acetolactate synthase large subunit [Duncaniella sp.]
VITGQVAVSSLGTEAFQESDVIGITQPITKWAYQIRRAEDIPWAVARAFYIASTGRPGPVVLDFTKDAQIGEIEWNEYKPINYIRSYNPDPELQPAAIAEAASLLNKAQCPMIIAGHGVLISEAGDDLLALAEKADIPVASTLLGLSSFPTDHPLNKGMVGMHGNIAPNIKTNEADVILAIGMRFDDRVTGRLDSYAKQAKIIHVDVDAAEFNKIVRSDVQIHADARKAIHALVPLINKASHAEWVESFDRPRQVEEVEVMQRELHPIDTRDGAMRMGQVIRKVSEMSGNNGILVTDVGQNQMMAARYFKYTLPKSVITSGGLGTMGFCLPAAIGAAIGAPERQVFAFMGDGGFQMTMQELGTIMEYHVPVKMIILNNNFLGNVRQWQSMFFNDHFMGTELLNPDFAMISQAYGIPAENVGSVDQLDAAIERMISSKTAYMLNVNIETEDMVFPMVAPGAATDDILINRTKKYQK